MTIEYNETETKEAIAKLTDKSGAMVAAAVKEQRELTAMEREVISEMAEHVGELQNHLKMIQPQRFTVEGFQSTGPMASLTGGARGLRSANDKKDFHALFGAEGKKWNDRNSTFFSAVFSGRFHPELQNASMTEGVPSDGGYLVPVEYSKKIHNVALESEVMLPRVAVQPMTTNEIKIPAMAISSHASSLFGGFTASFTAEIEAIVEHNPKTRNMTLNARKLTGLIRFSNELVEDMPNGEQEIIRLCGRGLGWYRDYYLLKGAGGSEPLGLLNSACKIDVAKETGQTASTILYENLTKMMSRMYAGSFNNSVWICHQSTIPQLLQLSLPVGVGGSAIPVMSESSGAFRMLTRPVIFTEKTEVLGTSGDIILADLSQYVCGLRSEMRFDTSAHVGFTTDELLARLISRFDGQPIWDTALTLKDGSTTVSPIVTLATRA